MSNKGENSPNWLALIIMVIIIAIFIMFAYLGTRKGTNKSNLTREERDELRLIELNYIEWITLGSIFLASAIIIKGFEQYSLYFSFVFLIIVIVILVVGTYEYLLGKERLRQRNIEVFNRLDYLAVITIIVTIICLAIIYDVLKSKILVDTFLAID